MSLTAGDANSSGLARNSPYSSSGSGAGAWAARVFAATPNTINVPEIRRCAGLINSDSSERHAIYRALATICFLRHAWRDHNSERRSFFLSSFNGAALFRQAAAPLTGAAATCQLPHVLREVSPSKPQLMEVGAIHHI